MLDARHFNSSTDRSDWLPEYLATQLARTNEKCISAINFMYACAHATLDAQTLKLIGFSSGDKIFAIIRGFCGLKSLPIFFQTTDVHFLQKLDPLSTFARLC